MQYWKTFSTFFKIGLFTIGGGYAMIPLIEREVTRNHWVEKEEFLDLLAVAQSLPGVFAVNISIFIGNKLGGIKGSICAAVGNVMPSVLCILLIALFFHRFKDYPVVAGVFMGIRPAVVALIAAPVFTMARAAKIGWGNVWIPLLAVAAIFLLGISPIVVIVAAALAGVAGFWWRQRKAAGKEGGR